MSDVSEILSNSPKRGSINTDSLELDVIKSGKNVETQIKSVFGAKKSKHKRPKKSNKSQSSLDSDNSSKSQGSTRRISLLNRSESDNFIRSPRIIRKKKILSKVSSTLPLRKVLPRKKVPKKIHRSRKTPLKRSSTKPKNLNVRIKKIRDKNGKVRNVYINADTGKKLDSDQIRRVKDKIRSNSRYKKSSRNKKSNSRNKKRLPQRKSVTEPQNEFETYDDIHKLRIPNYSKMSDSKRKRMKIELEFKYNTLRNDCKWLRCPALTGNENIEELHYKYIRQFDHYNSKLTGNKSRYFLIGYWYFLEYASTKWLGIDANGFAKSQISAMEEYEQLLMKLGEYKLLSIGEDWHPLVTLAVYSLIYMIAFVIVKHVAGSLGHNIQTTINSVVRSYLPVTNNQTAEDLPPIDAIPTINKKKSGGFGGLDGIMSMFSSFMGGGSSDSDDDLPEAPPFNE